MNRVFVDTSAVFALLVESDANHARAGRAFQSLQRRRADLLTSSYVLIETYALLLHRIGIDAVSDLRRDFTPLLKVAWIDEDLHERGLDLLLERGSRRLSLVDAVSFQLMKREQVDEAFAYDRHFQREGFTLVR